MIDLAAIKLRHQAIWATGDYAMIGTQLLIVSELLIEALDPRSSERILDVATGTGMPALAAARRNCDAVGVDYVPALLERGRRRADAEGLTVDFRVGDAEAPALPRRIVRRRRVSVFGAMFAPDQRRTAAELLRLPAGRRRIGLVSHTPEGFIGQLFPDERPPRPAAGRPEPPVLWGPRLAFTSCSAMGSEPARRAPRLHRSDIARRTPIDYWRTYYGPTIKASRRLDLPGQAARGGRPRPDRAFQPGRRRHHGRPERIPGGGCRIGHSRRAE